MELERAQKEVQELEQEIHYEEKWAVERAIERAVKWAVERVFVAFLTQNIFTKIFLISGGLHGLLIFF